MIEKPDKGFGRTVDRYLRKEDTLLAKGIKGICSLQGADYRNSVFKRGFELAITLPMATLSIPITAMLGVAARREDGGTAFYIQERVGKGGKPVDIVKVRSMKMTAPAELSPYVGNPEDDPRHTSVGRKIRALELDELPQLLQVLKGDISLIDVRIIPQYNIDYIKANRPKSFEAWRKAYEAGKPGGMNLDPALNSRPNHALTRLHYDMLYAKKASLGLDLYIIFKTTGRLLKKLGK